MRALQRVYLSRRSPHLILAPIGKKKAGKELQIIGVFEKALGEEIPISAEFGLYRSPCWPPA